MSLSPPAPSTTTTVPIVENTEHLLNQLEEKIRNDLQHGEVYEALQYVQSFIARKKKILGQKGVSTAVFLAGHLLTANFKNASYNKGKNNSTAATNAAATTTTTATTTVPTGHTLGTTTGALLKWFIEEGAGTEYQFLLYPEGINVHHYCDIENIYQFLNSLDVIIAGYIVEAIYNPIHVLIAKNYKTKKNSPLWKRINKLEILFANIFFCNKKWLQAFKSYNRLQDAEKMTEVLNTWSMEDGYLTEKPLFFARGIFQLLSENKISLAKDVLHNSIPLLEDNIGSNKKTGGANSSALTVWHLATILTDLANFPPMARVDKTKLFSLLYRRYAQFLGQLDMKLYDIFVKIGEVVFRFVLESTDNTPNPMALLQNLLTGGAGLPKPPQQNGGNNNNRNQQPAFDFDNLMKLMRNMNQFK